MKKTEVLVVDDERETCELLEMALSRQGMQVTTCTTAADALEKIASRDFDVVLTDLSMPETSGLEVCERVIALRPDVPVVLITGHATLETAMGAIRAGAYDFVTKPIESKTLGMVVARDGGDVANAAPRRAAAPAAGDVPADANAAVAATSAGPAVGLGDASATNGSPRSPPASAAGNQPAQQSACRM